MSGVVDAVAAAHEADADGHYPLTPSQAEQQRLADQAAFWDADACALIALAGIAPGARVADLGCGTGAVTRRLGEHVGRAGLVLALDTDPALLAVARAHAGSGPVRTVQGDAYALPWADATLDAVHARFLAAPAGRAEALLAEMGRVLRPGGVLLMQEPIADSWQHELGDPSWPRLRALVREGFRRSGGEFDVGARLGALMRTRLRDVHERHVVHRLAGEHPYAALPLAFAQSLAGTWRAHGLVDEAEREALCRSHAQALARPGAQASTFTLVQAWGRKP